MGRASAVTRIRPNAENTHISAIRLATPLNRRALAATHLVVGSGVKPLDARDGDVAVQFNRISQTELVSNGLAGWADLQM